MNTLIAAIETIEAIITWTFFSLGIIYFWLSIRAMQDKPRWSVKPMWKDENVTHDRFMG